MDSRTHESSVSLFGERTNFTQQCLGDSSPSIFVPYTACIRSSVWQNVLLLAGGRSEVQILSDTRIYTATYHTRYVAFIFAILVSMKKGIVIALGILFVFGVFAVATPNVDAESVEERRARLQKELEEVERQIKEQQVILSQKQHERVSVERDVAILEAEIQNAKLLIQKRTIEIQQLQKGIDGKTVAITQLTDTLERRKAHVAELIRQKNKSDNISMVELVLSGKKFSDFFEEVGALDEVKTELQNTFSDLRSTKQETHEEREALGREQNAVIDARKSIEQQKQVVESKQAEKERLLALKKSEENAYEALVNQKRAQAAQIRAALFSLRDSAAIPFGKAYEYALAAEKKTGIRPAFLLAILTQESNLGENVGTCNRPGDAQNWRDIMPGPGESSWRDDEDKYLKITSALGLDPDTMPLSCPWQGGWGGAMGPSQFIPTTWWSYKDRLGALLGVSMPNPWDPEHAFLASAVYLTDLGAGSQTYTGERTAALKYYAGSNWTLAKNQFYGDQVMGHANRIQTTMIDPLEAVR